MSTVIVTVLPATLLVAAVVFTAFWAGVAHQQRRTRAWARRALAAENIARILYEGVCDASAAIQSHLHGDAPLNAREAEMWRNIEREAGL